MSRDVDVDDGRIAESCREFFEQVTDSPRDVLLEQSKVHMQWRGTALPRLVETRAAHGERG